MRIHYQRGKFFASITTLTDGSNVYDVHVEGTGQFILFSAVDEADAITRVNALDAALSEELQPQRTQPSFNDGEAERTARTVASFLKG